MKKKWLKNSDSTYIFQIDEEKQGEMEIFFNTISSKAICTIYEKIFEIKRTGFWKSTIEIKDNNETLILKAYPEKWYANTSIIEYKNKKYKLIIRNNPLAEYAITENEKDILAYGLATGNREVKVKISTSDKSDRLLDFLLWYLFLPVATENSGDTFLMLSIA